jgi:hypothetical protein
MAVNRILVEREGLFIKEEEAQPIPAAEELVSSSSGSGESADNHPAGIAQSTEVLASGGKTSGKKKQSRKKRKKK